jgi:hypothetical protein
MRFSFLCIINKIRLYQRAYHTRSLV